VKRIIRILSVLIVAATPLLLITHSFAASSAIMYLTPSSATVAIGNTLTVGVYEDSGAQDVNAAKADLTYNANVLQYVSVTSSNAFSISAATSGGNGTVTIDRGAIPAVTGAQLVATVTFTAKAGGTSAISFGPNSKVLANSGSQANQNILNSTTGGTYTVPSPPPPPPPPPPPTPTPTPTPSPTPSPNPTPTPRPTPSPTPSPRPTPTPSPTPSPTPTPKPPVKDSTAPVISNVTVSDIGSASALVSWDTDENSTSQVDYGVTTNYELTNGNELSVTNHKLSLNYKLLNPDTEFHFRVKSVDGSGNVAISPDQTFTTKAGNASLNVKVVDQKDSPVAKAKVSVGKSTGTTNDSGLVTLHGLAVGTASVVVNFNGHKTTKSIEIDQPTDVPQSLTVKIQTTKNYVPLVALPLLGLLILAGGAFFLNGGRPKLPFSGSGTGGIPVIGGSAGTTITSGGSVPPPATPAAPTSSANTASSKGKTTIEPGDSNEPQPPTIVRPTIPPRA
jgi:hypothetical protein